MPVASDDSGIQILRVSKSPVRPSILLRLPNVSILLDCALDLSSLQHFLPNPVVNSERLDNLPSWHPVGNDVVDGSATGYLKECVQQVFVDGLPEAVPPSSNCADLASVDVILISNYTCMLSLPYLTEVAGFRGTVYATDPTVQIGKLLMEELAEYAGRLQVTAAPDDWKDAAIFDKLPQSFREGAAGHPHFWKQLYNMDAVSSCLEKIKLVAYREKTDVFGLATVTPISSGYSIGSANWLIETKYERIAYVSHSSNLATHPKAIDLVSLQGVDALILMGLTQHPVVHPDQMLSEFCSTVIQTVKDGGNVLVPCYPAGVVYDIFEILAAHLDSFGLSTVPVYFLSPVADSSLAFSNIFGEWLSDGKQAKVYLPEEPFAHSALARSGRLKHFSAIHEGLSNELKMPCIVFAGHPSLRFGDAVHFMELWGSSVKNAVVLPEPEFAHQGTVAPFQPLAMRTFFFPIDTSLNFSQVNKILQDLAPKRLFMPEEYTCPPPLLVSQQRPPETVQIAFEPAAPLKHNVPVCIPITRTVERVKIAPELAIGVGLAPLGDAYVAPLVGFLSAYNNDYVIRPAHLDPPGQKPGPAELPHPEVFKSLYPTPCGPLNLQGFVASLKKAGFDVTQHSEESLRLSHRKMAAPMSISLKGGQTNVTCEISANEYRKKVIDAFFENCSKI